jgi:integrase
MADNPKRRERHPVNALTAVRVRKEKKPSRYADGNGLYLVVDPSGARRWLLRIVIEGHRRDLGLGSAGLVPLSEAREKAQAYRKVARQGGDPVRERKRASAVAPTFRQAAEKVHTERKSNFRNAKHAAQWISTLRTYANPTIGELRVDVIGTPDIHRLVGPIWLSKAETARRVLQRISVVFDWAKAAGFRAGENPVDGVKQGLAKQSGGKKHHSSMPFVEVPAFVAMLRGEQSYALTHLPLEFLILTATRTSEVLNAKWTEVDFDNKIWTIPQERMKAKREHSVPLCQRCLEILRAARQMHPLSDYIFAGRDLLKPLSNMSLLEVMRRHKISYVPHGFRSSFRDWAGETTRHPQDVCEMALAHTISNKAEAAYRRGDMLERRRALMEDWDLFVTNAGLLRKPGSK